MTVGTSSTATSLAPGTWSGTSRLGGTCDRTGADDIAAAHDPWSRPGDAVELAERIDERLPGPLLEAPEPDRHLDVRHPGAHRGGERTELARLAQDDVRRPRVDELLHPRPGGLRVEPTEDVPDHRRIGLLRVSDGSRAKTGPMTSCGTSSNGTCSSPARATWFAKDSGAATRTSCPASTHARATGTMGPKCPVPAVVAKSIRMSTRVPPAAARDEWFRTAYAP